MTSFPLPWRQVLPLLVAQLVAQTKPSLTLDITLLQTQLEFFKDANICLASSFQCFTVNLVLVFFAAALGILGTIALFLYGKTLKEAKETIETQVRQEVERTISRTLKRRLDNLERVISRED